MSSRVSVCTGCSKVSVLLVPICAFCLNVNLIYVTDFDRESEACFVCFAGKVGTSEQNFENMKWLLEKGSGFVVSGT